MHNTDEVALRATAAALNEGDIEPLVQLMAPGLQWKGSRAGMAWFRPRPS